MKNDYPSFDIPRLPPIVSNIIEFLCITVFTFFNLIKVRFMVQDGFARTQTIWKQIILMCSIINILMIWIWPHRFYFPWIAEIIRPIYIIIENRRLRDYWMRYLFTIWDSKAMTIFILIFIGWFSWLCQRFFLGTL